MVTVRTLRRWWKTLIDTATPKAPRGGRKPTSPEVIATIIRLAKENSLGNDSWGRRRISGELKREGIDVSPSTVKRILAKHGIPPATTRGSGWDGPVAAAFSDPNTVALDFTTVSIGYTDKAQDHYVLAAIHQASRQVEILGITDHPNETWMAQIARNLTMADTGFLHRMQATCVIMDRDTKFTEQFRHIISPTPESPIQTLRVPPRSPQANGFIERWFRTVKTNLIRKAYWLDVEALRQALALYLEHYHTERPHQSLDNDPPMPTQRSIVLGDWKIIRDPRVGGLINAYRKEAA